MEKSIHSALYAEFLRIFRETRQRAGLTQVEVATRLGQTQSFVSKCERGERRIDVAELHAFCAAFGLSLRQFAVAFEHAIAQTQDRRGRFGADLEAKRRKAVANRRMR
jgi:transcriptional regulator with XRE-family HTH domain